MKLGNLRRTIFQKPFNPVRIVLESGDSITLYHPEMIIFGKDIVMIAGKPGEFIITEPAYITSVTGVKTNNNSKHNH